MPGPDEYWSSDSDPYIDHQTGILKNIPALRTEAQLEAFEETVFQAHFPEVTAYAESCHSFSLQEWKIIHGVCFSEVYAWAGEIRTVRLQKDKTVFAHHEHIESAAADIFQALNADLENDDLTLEKCAAYYGDLNVLHPFREGNGRTQRILFAAVLKRIGYQTDYTRLDVGHLIGALIRAYHGDNALIERLFREVTSRG